MATPASVLSEDLPGVISLFSTSATELMAERARATWELLRAAMDELGEHMLGSLKVKVGFVSETGHREHLWFDVADLEDDTLRGTLVSEPYHITYLRRGALNELSELDVTDWAAPSKRGIITPADLAPLRKLRAQYG